MNLAQLTLLVTLVINLALGVFVLLTNPRRGSNRVFFGVSLVLATWLVCVLLITAAKEARWAAFWIRQASAVALLIPLSGQVLRHAIMTGNYRWTDNLRRFKGMLFSAALIVVLCQTRYFVREVVMPETAGDFQKTHYGPGFWILAVYYVTAWLVLLVQLVRDTRRATGVTRNELYFVLLGFPSGVFLGLLFSLGLPLLTGNFIYAAFSPLSILLLDASIAYGIATRRIMEAADVLRRVTAYALLVVYLVLLYAVVWLPSHGLVMRYNGPAALPHVLAALVVAFAMTPAHGRLQRFANRLFVNVPPLDVASLMYRTTAILSSISTLDDLLHRFAQSLTQAVGTDRIFILLGGSDGYQQRYPPASEEPPLCLHATDPLVEALKSSQMPLCADLMLRVRPSPQQTQAARQLHQLRAAIAVKIHSPGQQDGILLLGPRLSGRMYGALEQDTLQILCNQLAVAIENAQLYTQVQDGKLYNEILLDNLVSGVIAVDNQRRISVFNREAQRITRLDAAAVLNQDLAVLPEPLREPLERTLAGGTRLRDADVVLRHAPTEETPIRLGSSVFKGHTGQVLGALLVFNDLTDLRKLEMQIRRTERLASVGTLAAGMAHEIKNPLVSIKTFTQLLPERYEDTDFRKTFSSLIGHEVKRIDTIVNQLLRFSRPSRPNMVPTHLHRVLEDALSLVGQQIRQKGIELVRDFAAARDLVRADADQLSQVFINILLNGIEAMTNGVGTLRVATEIVEATRDRLSASWDRSTSTRSIRVTISDTGVGIPPENLGRIFDPFFTTKSQGTGLGLSVAHRIIEEHGGSTDVFSEVGAGATFFIYLPLMEPEATA